MVDFFMQYPLYIVMSIAVICWAGIFGYVHNLHRSVLKLERTCLPDGEK